MSSSDLPALAIQPEAISNLVECLTIHTTARAHRCPCCKSVVYSRRFATCRDCGEVLPDEIHLGADEAARLS